MKNASKGKLKALQARLIWEEQRREAIRNSQVARCYAQHEPKQIHELSHQYAGGEGAFND